MWQLHANRHCAWDNGGGGVDANVQTLAGAQAECERSSTCFGVYDCKCTGDASCPGYLYFTSLNSNPSPTIQLCPAAQYSDVNDLPTSSVGSCVYEKTPALPQPPSPPALPPPASPPGAWTLLSRQTVMAGNSWLRSQDEVCHEGPQILLEVGVAAHRT